MVAFQVKVKVAAQPLRSKFNTRYFCFDVLEICIANFGTATGGVKTQDARTGQKLGEKIPCFVSRDRPKRPAPVRVMTKKRIKLTSKKLTGIKFRAYTTHSMHSLVTLLVIFILFPFQKGCSFFS